MRGPNLNPYVRPAERDDPSLLAETVDALIDGCCEELGMLTAGELALLAPATRRRMDAVLLAAGREQSLRDRMLEV